MDVTAIRSLYRYSDWATDHLLTLAELLPSERIQETVGASFGSIGASFAHLFHAEIVWVNRWRGDAGRIDLPSEASYDAPALRARWPNHRGALAEFVAELTPERLASTVDYTNTAGKRFRQPLWQLMHHVVVHGAHHRSEIADMLTRFGQPPQPLDYVHFLRLSSSASDSPT